MPRAIAGVVAAADLEGAGAECRGGTAAGCQPLREVETAGAEGGCSACCHLLAEIVGAGPERGGSGRGEGLGEVVGAWPEIGGGAGREIAGDIVNRRCRAARGEVEVDAAADGDGAQVDRGLAAAVQRPCRSGPASPVPR